MRRDAKIVLPAGNCYEMTIMIMIDNSSSR